MIPDDTISLWRVYFGIGNFLWELVRGLLHWISTGTRKLHLACQTIVRSRIMSARTEPSGEFVILPAFFFMYAFRILVLSRVLYVLAPVRSKQNVRDKVGPLEDSAGDIITEGILMAEEINMHFSSVFTREDTSSLPVPETKFNGSEEEKLGQLIVTPELVASKINNIKETKSPGVDGLPPKILKETVEQISKPLAHVFNMSLQEGIVPLEWKEANIIPLFKKGSRNKSVNYRPVSLTSVICKLLETIIRDHMMDFLVKHK